ncbi:MAG TPA: hypothetical protein VGJ53_19480 [Micromonosporaceae bacterium]|jgi:hypothetical protein
MAERSHARATAHPPGNSDAGDRPGRTPSGLFPSRTSRPTYREPHPVRGGTFTLGLLGGAVWILFFGLLGRDLRGYAIWTAFAGVVAWLVAGILVRYGDRGVAAGVAISTAVGLAAAAAAVATRWAGTGDWPLW